MADVNQPITICDPASLLPFEKRLEDDDGSAERVDPDFHNLDAPVITSDVDDEKGDEGVY